MFNTLKTYMMKLLHSVDLGFCNLLVESECGVPVKKNHLNVCKNIQILFFFFFVFRRDKILTPQPQQAVTLKLRNHLHVNHLLLRSVGFFYFSNTLKTVRFRLLSRLNLLNGNRFVCACVKICHFWTLGF